VRLSLRSDCFREREGRDADEVDDVEDLRSACLLRPNAPANALASKRWTNWVGSWADDDDDEEEEFAAVLVFIVVVCGKRKPLASEVSGGTISTKVPDACRRRMSSSISLGVCAMNGR
jgi:hypothetical protein